MTDQYAPEAMQQYLDSSLLIGVPSIDQEHHDLVTQLESLITTTDAHPNSEHFSEIFSRLGQQITDHFVHEEEIFRALDMPADEVQDHVQTHTEILNQYVRLNIDLMEGQPLARSDVLRMIKRWIVDHVLQHDIRIRNYLPKHRAENN